MSRRTIQTLAVALVVLGAVVIGQTAPGEPAAGKVRIATYRSRPVALAYLRSERFRKHIRTLEQEVETARRKEDTARVETLEQSARERQNLAHMQVFSNAPIHDIVKELAPVIEREAKKQAVSLVVRDIDIAYRDPGVELVDITSALVAACTSDTEEKRRAMEIDDHPPLPLERFPIDCDDHGEHQESSARSDPEKSGALCAELWLRLVDDGKYAGSWDKASVHFRSVVPMKRWVHEMEGLRGPLGKLVKREVVSRRYTTKLPDAPPGQYVVVVFGAKYEHADSAAERVTSVLDPDGCWRVDGYYMQRKPAEGSGR